MKSKENIHLSIFGSSGFIGSNFIKKFPFHSPINRDKFSPLSNDILYLISTVDNYNIFTDCTKDVHVNLEILCKVLDNCKSNDITFNFISSWFVYGKTDILPVTESSICKPKGFYSITKKCAEDLIISFCHTFDVKYRIIRLCNVLGKGDKSASKKKNAITWMINQLKENKPISLYKGGLIKRDIMHVNDVCNAIDLICRSGSKNETYNVSSGEPTKIIDIINIAYKLINSKSKISYIEPPEFHNKVQNLDFWMNNQKLIKLGFSLEYELEDIINDLC